jgi:hypothetical protein
VALLTPTATAPIPDDGGSAALCPTAAVPALPVDKGGAALCPTTGMTSVVILCMLCETTESLVTRHSKIEHKLVKSKNYLATVRRRTWRLVLRAGWVGAEVCVVALANACSVIGTIEV